MRNSHDLEILTENDDFFFFFIQLAEDEISVFKVSQLSWLKIKFAFPQQKKVFVGNENPTLCYVR